MAKTMWRNEGVNEYMKGFVDRYNSITGENMVYSSKSEEIVNQIMLSKACKTYEIYDE
jgi:hypothetical protein